MNKIEDCIVTSIVLHHISVALMKLDNKHFYAAKKEILEA